MRNFYNEFKTPIITISLLFLAFFVYTKLAGPIPFYINSVNTTKTDLFSSSGQGSISAVPDTALISLGITKQATTVSNAQNKTNELTKKIIDNIKKLGIAEKDIKTTNYSVYPNYGSDIRPLQSNGTEIAPMMYPIRNDGNNIIGYTVTQNLEIKVKPIDKVNEVIDAGTTSGANLVGGVNFTFSDELQKSLEEKARKEAVDNAKAKAKSLASAAGVRLGRVVNVVENSNFPYYPVALKAEMGQGGDQPVPSNVTPGENEVIINVIIYYETY